ncbi:MAG: hypothetical protein RL375_3368 [Pseudomonadota bacterium]
MAAPHPSFVRLLSCAQAATAELPPAQRVKTAADLKRALSWAPQRLTNMKTRGVSRDGALEAERLFGCPATYVLDGAPETGWMPNQHVSAGEKPAPWAVAQDLSHPAFDAVPLLKREQLVDQPRPDVFRFALADDAMAPEFPAGTELVWTTRRRIAPGRLLLLQDAHGQLHVRRCHQGAQPGTWLATATNPAFRALDSTEPGVLVLAVFKGRLEPDEI